jgi:hypothetical protein
MSLAIPENKKIIVFSSVAQIWAPAHVLPKTASRARTNCRGPDISIGQPILEFPSSGLAERGNAPATPIRLPTRRKLILSSPRLAWHSRN